jgi:uncharacterized membrane protein (DUF485 family)
VAFNNSSAPSETTAEPGDSVGLTRNGRHGLLLFLVYLILYAGFVALNAFAADRMARPVLFLGGVNLAVAYGMLLILAAFVLAMIYMALCTASGDLHDGANGNRNGEGRL